MTDIYLPLLVGATVYFAQPDALRVSRSLHFPAKIFRMEIIQCSVKKLGSVNNYGVLAHC